MDSRCGRDAVVDLGKTSCRLRVGTAVVAVPGAGGLAERDGVEHALTAVLAAHARLDATVAAGIDRVTVGAAGALSRPAAAEELAARIVDALAVDAAVTSDVVSAHAGALAGRPGTVLVAGTGSVAFGIAADGTTTRADGAGIWLGDDGSGRWIGQQGLRAAVRAADGRGPATVLVDQAVRAAGSVDALPAWIGGGPAPERRLAAFAPAVLAAATAGDAVARDIRTRAVAELVATCRAAVPVGTAQHVDTPEHRGTVEPAVPAGTPDVVVLGGLTGDEDLRRLLAAALADAGLTVRDRAGDALDGAERIAVDPGLPHERQVTRVHAARAA